MRIMVLLALVVFSAGAAHADTEIVTRTRRDSLGYTTTTSTSKHGTYIITTGRNSLGETVTTSRWQSNRPRSFQERAMGH